jgi:phosphoribosyl 1,2-cyclic phosphodiesterase
VQPHHGDSYGYRFEHDNKAVVYSTDAEHKLESETETAEFVEFFKAADLVIFDAMYTMADMISVKEDWGHSSNIIGVDLCHRAGVKHYCMFHHEPVFGDKALADILTETIRYEEIIRDGHELKVSSAYDGLEIVI